MNKTKIFKAAALINFMCLIVVFILFRLGVFPNYFQSESSAGFESPNGGASAVINSAGTAAPDSAERARLASSKSAILVQKINLFSLFDSLSRDSAAKKTLEEKRIRMYTSKSALIIDPNLLSIDTSNKDLHKPKAK